MASPSDDSTPPSTGSGVASASTFLGRVLPQGDAEGWLNAHWKTAGGMPGESCTSVAAMLAVIERLKSRFDVYCCMSSQAVKGRRHARDARFLKSLFLDVDVKAGAFATPVEALQAFNMFRGAVGLPRPTLYVMTAGSTGGFHCHWVVDHPLAKAEWLPLAEALKEAAKRHKFTIDMNVIADAARVLRIPDTTNFKYADRPPVVLYPSIVERDYALDEIAAPLTPYMGTRPLGSRMNSEAATAVSNGTADADAPRPMMSKLFAGLSGPGMNDDLTAGLFNFAEFEAAVRSLTRKGWFAEHQYDQTIALCFACAHVEITERTDEARALYFTVVDLTARNPTINEQRYADALRRTRERIRLREEIQTPGTIFHWAHEQGWAPVTATPLAPAIAVELALVRAKAIDAYKMGRLRSREQARVLLARFCKTVDGPDIRRELAKTVAGVLAQDDWPFALILNAGTFLGLEPPAAASLAHWAIRKLSVGAKP